MPAIFTGIGIQRDDGREEEIVALAIGADLVVPGAAIADTDVELVELLIIDDGIPDGATAAGFPELAIPCRVGFGFQNGIRHFAVGTLRGIAGDGVKAPDLLAGLGVIGADIAAHAELGTAVADDDLALDDARGAGDRVGLRLVEGDGGPFDLAGGGIDCDQPAIEGAEEERAVPGGEAAVDDIAAGGMAAILGNLGIVGPLHLAGGGIEGDDFGPCCGGVHGAVNDQWRGFLPAVAVSLIAPGEAELADVAGVDLVEVGVALFGIGAAVGHPVARLGGRSGQPLVVNPSCRVTPGHGGQQKRRRQRHQARTCRNPHNPSPASVSI